MLPVNITDLSNIFLTGDATISFTAKKTAFDTLGLSSIASFDGATPSAVYTITEEVATNNPDLGLSAGTNYALSRTASGEWEMLPVNIKDPMSLLLNELTQVGNYDPFVSSPIYTFSQSDIENNPDLGVGEGSYALIGDDINGWKLEQLDISNPENIIAIVDKVNSSYKVTFNIDLADGKYTLVLTDDAGNKVLGNENHQFSIETIAPEISTLLLDEGLDTGSSGEDRRTTERKPDFSFISETQSRVFIERVIDTDANDTGHQRYMTYC